MKENLKQNKKNETFSNKAKTFIISSISIITIASIILNFYYHIKITYALAPNTLLFWTATVFFLFSKNEQVRQKARALALYLLWIPFSILLLTIIGILFYSFIIK